MIILFAVAILILVLICILFRQTSNDSAPLLFIHIPKNAGTTIYEIGLYHKIDWRYLNTTHICGNCSSWHKPPNEKLNRPSFCVVRNPYTRVISEYKYRNSEISVDGLNRFISAKLDQTKNNPYVDDCHWLPQYNYVKYCDHVLHFENLQEEFDNLMKQYNLNISLDRHENKGKETLSVDDISSENKIKIRNYFSLDFEKLGYNN